MRKQITRKTLYQYSSIFMIEIIAIPLLLLMCSIPIVFTIIDRFYVISLFGPAFGIVITFVLLEERRKQQKFIAYGNIRYDFLTLVNAEFGPEQPTVLYFDNGQILADRKGQRVYGVDNPVVGKQYIVIYVLAVQRIMCYIFDPAEWEIAPELLQP